MKRLFITIVLIVSIIILTMMVISNIREFTNGASLILSGVSTKEIETVVRDYYRTAIASEGKPLESTAHIELTPAYINTDTDLDIIARIESEDTCGSGGCITTLFVRSVDTLEPVPFGYAVKELTVMDSISNHMHDIKVNNSKTMFTWDGERYVINQ